MNLPPWPVAACTAHRQVLNHRWAQQTLYETVCRLRDDHDTRVGITGMAFGGDLLWARAVLAAGLQLWAYIPYPQQPDPWPDPAQVEWRLLRELATRVRILGKHHDVRLLHARNDAMIADAQVMVAYLDPSRTTGSGTFSAFVKARRRLPVIHLNPVTRDVADLFTPDPRYGRRSARTREDPLPLNLP